MKTTITQKTAPANRVKLPDVNRAHETKHAAAERWLHRPRYERDASRMTRWFG